MILNLSTQRSSTIRWSKDPRTIEALAATPAPSSFAADAAYAATAPPLAAPQVAAGPRARAVLNPWPAPFPSGSDRPDRGPFRGPGRGSGRGPPFMHAKAWTGLLPESRTPSSSWLRGGSSTAGPNIRTGSAQQGAGSSTCCCRCRAGPGGPLSLSVFLPWPPGSPSATSCPLAGAPPPPGLSGADCRSSRALACCSCMGSVDCTRRGMRGSPSCRAPRLSTPLAARPLAAAVPSHPCPLPRSLRLPPRQGSCHVSCHVLARGRDPTRPAPAGLSKPHHGQNPGWAQRARVPRAVAYIGWVCNSRQVTAAATDVKVGTLVLGMGLDWQGVPWGLTQGSAGRCSPDPRAARVRIPHHLYSTVLNCAAPQPRHKE